VPNVRRCTPDDVADCVAIVLDLPNYFTSDVPQKVRAAIGTGPAWVAIDANRLVGFSVVGRRSSRSAEILWMAVLGAVRGKGIGTALLNHVLDELCDDGVRLVEVKTLDQAAGYEPYVATRAFWEQRGFIQIDMIDPLPGWQAGNPAAIYVAVLGCDR
jgi:GNAT superfamily N-acetyltransferase